MKQEARLTSGLVNPHHRIAFMSGDVDFCLWLDRSCWASCLLRFNSDCHFIPSQQFPVSRRVFRPSTLPGNAKLWHELSVWHAQCHHSLHTSSGLSRTSTYPQWAPGLTSRGTLCFPCLNLRLSPLECLIGLIVFPQESKLFIDLYVLFLVKGRPRKM